MITIHRHIKEAIAQLKASKLRSILAVLGILVGTASVVAMVSIGELAENQILSQFKTLGINLLSVSVYPDDYSTSLRNNPFATLTLKSAEKIKTADSNVVEVAPYIPTYKPLNFLGHTLHGSTVGITPTMFSLAKLHLHSGRMFTFLDEKTYFCVIGHQIAKTLAPWTDNPIGKQIALGDSVFTIIGTLDNWPVNFFFNTDFNNAILVPVQTAMSIHKNAHISNVAIRIKDTEKLEQTKKHIDAYIKKHTIHQHINIKSPKSLIDSMKKSSETMTLLLGLIGSISLVVGGIGVMNIMLVSVTERRKEIGIRLAIGARQKDIQMQFLIESVALSVFGGISGMILGIVITYFVSIYSKWAFALFLMPPAIGALVSIAVGIFFGFYPARKAAKLDPILCLRSD